MAELTITSQTTIADIEKFASKLGDNAQIRAKTDKNGNTVLYSKNNNNLFGSNTTKRKQKADLAMNAIQSTINKSVGSNSKAGKMLQNVVKASNPTTKKPFLTGQDLKNVLKDVEAAQTKAAKMDKVSTMISDKSSLPYNKRPQLMVAMGQGAVGRLDQVQIYSDSFSSCMPVIMYNEETKMGGMFHVPSPSFDEDWRDYYMENDKTMPPLGDDSLNMSYRDGVRDSLKEMIELIKPTKIIVQPGGHGHEELNAKPDPYTSKTDVSVIERADYVAQDMQKLSNDLDIECDVDFRKTEPMSTISLTEDNGKPLVFNGDLKNGGDVNLLENGLPNRISDKALVWTTDVSDAKDVLTTGSKFGPKLDTPNFMQF